MKKEFKIVINSKSVTLDFLALRVYYTIQVIGFESLTKKPKAYSCPLSAKITQGKSILGVYLLRTGVGKGSIILIIMVSLLMYTPCYNQCLQQSVVTNSFIRTQICLSNRIDPRL